MKICFISNYFNHHQKPFCDAMFSRFQNDFVFIATTSMKQDRAELGYGMTRIPDYVKNYFESSQTKEQCDRWLDQAEVVLIGSAFPELIKNRIHKGKLVFRYSERLTKSFSDCLKLPIWGVRWREYYSYPNVHLLCASAFTYRDFSRIGFFRNRAYKWGYYPETKEYDWNALMTKKKRNKIVWCGRLIDWKHPDDAVLLAKHLKESGYSFEMELIGTGEMFDSLKKMIVNCGFSENVKLLGAMRPAQVREHMEEAGIYLFTSDFNEGWGAVLNESMNSGCAVVASHAIGAVPFLMKHGENGIVYKSGGIGDLYRKTKYLLDHPEEQSRLGENAYHTIVDLWNANTAAEHLLTLIEEIRKNGSCDLFEDGPCSRASRLKNHWFTGDII